MSQFGKDLEMYANNGLRTAAQWLTLGRQVEGETKPRTQVSGHGEMFDLYTRDQTQPRARSQRR